MIDDDRVGGNVAVKQFHPVVQKGKALAQLEKKNEIKVLIENTRFIETTSLLVKRTK